MGSAQLTVADPLSLHSLGASLPSYETHGDAGPPTYNNTRPGVVTRERAEHIFHLMDGKGKPSATLKFHSSARSAENVPVVLGGDAIAGTFELNTSNDHIVEIAIVVGYMSTNHRVCLR